VDTDQSRRSPAAANSSRVLRFSNVAIDGAAWETIEDAIVLADSGRYADAEALLADEFGGVCEEQDPTNELDDGRVSRCHRHRDEYDDVATVIERRRADD